jgi:hypothetical protein
MNQPYRIPTLKSKPNLINFFQEDFTIEITDITYKMQTSGDVAGGPVDKI